MLHSPAAEVERQIIPNQIAHIEISRSTTADSAQVRVFVASANEPYLFEFDSMGAAIKFYERLWSLRTAGDDNAAASNTA